MAGRRRLPLFRCDRCGLTLYGPPNGVEGGERCRARVIGEWAQWGGLLYTECFGTFEPMGTLSPAKTA